MRDVAGIRRKARGFVKEEETEVLHSENTVPLKGPMGQIERVKGGWEEEEEEEEEDDEEKLRGRQRRLKGINEDGVALGRRRFGTRRDVDFSRGSVQAKGM
ncbi:hypothetical protein KM043_005790 [Ampulex compressa]|nr:hypothetical protein KM043_005790 [Ampulex compressa]